MKKALVLSFFEVKASLFISIFMLFASGIFAQASISVQGVLTKSDGTAVDDGVYSLTFRLWTAATGGTEVHSETINNVETVGGVYSVVLGASGFNPAATFTQTYYLGVSLGGSSTEFLPRPRLTSAPYSIGVIGSSNIIKGDGVIEATGVKADGGVPSVPVAGRGYSFRNSGDQDGGLFSYADDQVSLFTNGAERIKVTGGLTELKTTNTNTFHLFTYGNTHSSGGYYWHNNGGGQLTGLALSNNNAILMSGGEERIYCYADGNNYYRAYNGKQHLFDQGAVTMNNNVTMNSNLFLGGTLVAGNGASGGHIKGRTGNNGGFTFHTPGGVDDTDSGMFSPQDGEVHIKTNDFTRMLFGSNGSIYINNPSGGGVLYQNSPEGGSGGSNTARIRISDGLIFRETSSRRYKTNIRPLADDFRKILLVQPKIYNRINDPKEDELGYIAEELDSIGLKTIVIYRPDGLTEGVNYEKMGMYTLEIVKTHEATITQLKAEIEALKKENATLTTSLQQQQTTFGSQLAELEKRMKLMENAGATGMRK